MKEFMEEVKPFIYFARWTNNALELTTVLTQAFKSEELHLAILDYWQNTYIPALLTEGRMRYELESSCTAVVKNLTALRTILQIDHSEVDYVIEDLFVDSSIEAFLGLEEFNVQNGKVAFPDVTVGSRLPAAKRAVEEKILNLVKFIQTQEFSKYLDTTLEDFCTRQEVRWSKEKTNG